MKGCVNYEEVYRNQMDDYQNNITDENQTLQV
jgi:hypothetical protein